MVRACIRFFPGSAAQNLQLRPSALILSGAGMNCLEQDCGIYHALKINEQKVLVCKIFSTYVSYLYIYI